MYSRLSMSYFRYLWLNTVLKSVFMAALVVLPASSVICFFHKKRTHFPNERNFIFWKHLHGFTGFSIATCLLICCFSVLLARRIAFKDYEGRRDAAKKITEESKKIEKLFKKLAKASLEPETQCSVLPTLAEVIKLRDTSMMALEISVSSNTCDGSASLAVAPQSGLVTQFSFPLTLVHNFKCMYYVRVWPCLQLYLSKKCKRDFM